MLDKRAISLCLPGDTNLNVGFMLGQEDSSSLVFVKVFEALFVRYVLVMRPCTRVVFQARVRSVPGTLTRASGESGTRNSH